MDAFDENLLQVLSISFSHVDIWNSGNAIWSEHGENDSDSVSGYLELWYFIVRNLSWEKKLSMTS